MSVPYLNGADDRLRRHHREAGLHHRQPERDRLLRLRRLVPLIDRQARAAAPRRPAREAPRPCSRRGHSVEVQVERAGHAGARRRRPGSRACRPRPGSRRSAGWARGDAACAARSRRVCRPRLRLVTRRRRTSRRRCRVVAEAGRGARDVRHAVDASGYRGYPEPYRGVVSRDMSLLIAGSIATDHLMSFPGKFSDSPGRRPAGQALALLPRRGPRGTPRRLRRQHLLRPRQPGPAPGAGRRRGRGLRRVPLVARAPQRRLRLRARLRDPAHRPLRVHQRLVERPDRRPSTPAR